MKTKIASCFCAAAFGLAFSLGTQSALGLVTVAVQPGSLVVLVGSNAVFNAQTTVTAGETITGYTWLMSTNGQSPFTTIAGATTATCTITNAQLTDAGSYFTRVTYNSGTNIGLTSVSAAVSLTVYDQARIITQPVGGLIRPTGSNASFTITAAGSAPLTYQWRLNGVNLTNGPRITGADAASLAVSALVTADSGSYDVVVTNIYSAATSQVATLSVFIPPGITVPPQDTAVIVGSNATLSVTATGSTPMSYVWRKDGVILANGGRISGATTNKLTIAATITNDAGGYSVSLSNIVGSLTSSVATLTVLVPPTITSGSNAGGRQGLFFSFTNTATGTTPITFGAQGLPAGLSIEPTNGVISGIPAVFGTFNVTVFATNAPMTPPGPLVTAGPLRLTLTTGIPGINSALSASGKQGQPFSYTITASNNPTTFSASSLPNGLDFDPGTGIITGTPMVNGIFLINIGATNQYGGDNEVLTLSIASSVPVITSSLSANGKQGSNFTYTIQGTDNPTNFTASALPTGLNFNPATGTISGPPIVSGVFLITISASNQFGTDVEVLTLTISSSLPVITSSRTATGTENQSGFSYTIRASNSPYLFGATGLPLGLTLNTTNGAITGTPLYGGTFNIQISAINAWGTGSTNLVLTVNYATLGGLSIANVMNTYSSPYLLDFSFSLLDNSDPTDPEPVVRLPTQLQVVCMEGGVPIPSETAYVLEKANNKQLKSYLVLDYSYSMFAAPGAIDAMQSAAENFINVEPSTALFGICEFHADYVAPNIVTTNPVTTNSFIADKPTLSADIEGIQTNYVQGNYAGSRCWDAVYLALQQFGTTNSDEQRYLVVMSDGNDDSSLLNTNADPVGALVTLAQANQVRIYAVAFGANVNTNALQQLTSQTLGQYYLAATTADLPLQFEKIAKNLDGQYALRWATLQRVPVPFQPSFLVSLGSLTASFNTNLIYKTNVVVDTNQTPAVTNTTVTNILVLPYNPTNYAGDVKAGYLRLVPDADVGPETIRLRAGYVPRYVREIQLYYQPNYPCTASLDSTDTNNILYGWSMTETNISTNGLRMLTLLSSNPTNLLTSIAYGAFGDLVSFNFTYPNALTATQAFSVLSINNGIYTNMQPTGQSFTISNAPGFITLYTNPPPHGTPIPWLIYYGFKTNFAAAELIATNGLAVWQDYIAGLNPTNPASQFEVWTAFAPGQMPQIMFSTVTGRTYRLESATILGSWSVLRDNMPGTGGNILFIDNRTLSGVQSMYYRVAVY